MKHLAYLLGALVAGGNAFAAGEPMPMLGGKAPAESSLLNVENATYQIGDEWGKKPVTADEMSESEVLQRGASLTAKVRGATGFLLGKYGGEYYLATNNHVCPRAWSCSRTRANFTKLGKSYRVKKFLGSFKDIDFAVMTLTIPAADQPAIDALLLDFDFRSPIYPGQNLLTVGFGVANNSRRQMMANRDSDCKVFSAEDEFRYMGDPDAKNPGPNKVWSFANGCDVSHGDSGSAMIDRDAQTIVGIIWTGKIPKNARVQDSAYLDQVLAENSEDVWTELSYAVPAAKIAEVMQAQVDSGGIKGEKADLIRAIFQ